MPPQPPDSAPPLERCFTRLADCLIEQREPITRLWIDGVRRHPGIPSARTLTFQQLSDHLPKLFEDMAASLRTGAQASAQAEGHTVEDARAHGQHRWEQNFRLDELLRELSIIRALIMRHGFEQFLQRHPACAPDLGAAQDLIIRFFEETTIGSVEQYIEEQQHQLEALNEDLNRIDASRLRLLGTVAHELGNSVYSLKMITNALSAGSSAEDERTRILRLSESAFSEIQTFLTQLTDYSAVLSLPAVDLVAVDIRLFCEELAGAFRPAAAEAGMRFSVEIDDALSVVWCDRLKLKRIASNLLSNAIKFRQADRADSAFTLRLGLEGQAFWTLAVEDNGVGVAPADRERIFEEFARLPSKVERPGAGLGLAVTRRLAELLDGEITVDSAPQGGCRFVVRLPLRAGAA